MTTVELNRDIEHIRKDIASLREDIAGLTVSLKHLAAERGRETLSRIEELSDRTKVKTEDLKHAAERGIGEHPLTSVLGSFGLGFLLGIVLDPKR